MRGHARQFVRTYLTLTLCLLAGIAAFNALADPYNVYPAVHVEAFVPHKPNNDHRRAKAGIIRQHTGWRTVLMGSSYAVVGMDATHPALPQPAFNIGHNGGKLEEQIGALRYALQHDHEIRHVVLIYDNTWLMQSATPSVDYVNSPFNPGYSLIEYQGSNLLGMQATEHAWHAVRAWLRGDPATDNPYGRRLTPLIPEGKPQRLLFDDFLQSRDLTGMMDGDEKNLAILHTFGELCLVNEIKLIVLIAPSHISLLEHLDNAGYWADWEDGKRRLVASADSLNQTHPNAVPIHVWDFNSVGPYTTEPVPDMDDTQTRLAYYWDPGHFKKQLGDIMIGRIFTDTLPGDGFGRVLTPDNIEDRLAALRSAYENHNKSQNLP